MSAIKETAKKYQIDNGNINLTGFSMGGAGVWGLAVSYPKMFHSIAPCSGGLRVTKTTLSALRNMKVWTFVGTADQVVKPQPTIDFMNKLTRSNAKAAITQFEGAEHTDVPTLVYLSDEINLIDWLIEK